MTTAVGVSIDATTGLLTWTPATTGTFRIQINVVDEFNLGVAQIFDVNVLASVPNNAPRITSTPSLLAEQGAVYSYDVNATDPDGNTLTYRLVTPSSLPSNMAFNTSTGLLTWTPSSAQANSLVSFEVEASDGTLTSRQIFKVWVTPPNVSPDVTQIPNQTITAGHLAVQLTIRNAGTRAFQLQNLVVTALSRSRDNPARKASRTSRARPSSRPRRPRRSAAAWRSCWTRARCR